MAANPQNPERIMLILFPIITLSLFLLAILILHYAPIYLPQWFPQFFS